MKLLPGKTANRVPGVNSQTITNTSEIAVLGKKLAYEVKKSPT